MPENEGLESKVMFRGKSFEIEKIEMSTRFSPISIFNISSEEGKQLKLSTFLALYQSGEE